MAILYFFGRSVYGWAFKKSFTKKDEYFIWSFNQVFLYQFFFGLTLWVAASPFVKTAFLDPASIFKNPLISFWTLQHPLTMIFAVGIFHGGKAKARKSSAEHKFQIYAVTFGLIILMVGSAIPWPFLSYGRTLFRGF